MRFGILVIFFLVTVFADSPSGRQAVVVESGGCGSPPTLSQRALARGLARDATATARLNELVRASTIVREMLAYLDTARVALTIHSSVTLMRDHRSGGLSRFFVDQGVLNGRLEFDRTRDAHSQRITLAHEVAHAVELAALPRRSTTALGNQLLSQIGQHDPWSSRLTIETPFARDVDARVTAELNYGETPPGTLDTIAKRHRVTLTPCAPDRRRADAVDEWAGRGKKD